MTVRDDRFAALLGPGAPVVAAVFDALPDAIGAVWPVIAAAGDIVDFEVGCGGGQEGSRIGLATCRRIVEGHGGRIWAEPAPGGGSRLSFTLTA